MPSIGVTARAGPVDPGALRRLQPAHLRVTVEPPDRDRVVRRATSLAREIGVPLELVLLFDDEPEGADLLGKALEDAPLARVLALRRDGVTTDGRFVARARPDLPSNGAGFFGGTASHFSELNRLRPSPDGMDGVALAMSPQAHTIDERSMVETLEIQGQIVRQVSGFSRGLPVAVSPVTLAAREPPHEQVPIDHRVGSSFGAAWTAGSVANLRPLASRP